MLRCAADENFNNGLLRALFRRRPDVDIVRIQDAGLSGANDEAVLEWAAAQGRVLLTHDVRTMTKCANQRAQSGKAMPGVFAISRAVPYSSAIEDILLLAECSLDGEWEGQIRYLPLR